MYNYVFSGVATAMRGALAFTRARISLLGVRRFGAEVAAVYAIDEIVDLSANYNDWVKENSIAIKTVLTLGLFTQTTGLAYLQRKGGLKSAKVLFSRLPLQFPVSKLTALLAKVSVSASATGCVIKNGAATIFEMSVANGKIHISHKLGVVAGAVLAAGLAGKVPSTREEWEATGQQLALHLADATYTAAEYELRTRLEKFSPLSLLRTGASHLEAFAREYPFFPHEHAVSVYQDVLNTESYRVGSWSVDAFATEKGEQIIRINGIFYEVVKGSNTSVLRPVSKKKEFREPTPEVEGAAINIKLLLKKISDDGSVTLVRVGDTSRFVSTPFIIGDYGLALVIDDQSEDSGGLLQFVYARDSWFDSATDNLEDDFGEGGLETLTRIFRGASETVVNFAGSIVGAESHKETYRSDIRVLLFEDLYESMGKW